MAQHFQDALLNAVRRDNTPVTIFLTNGFQIRGLLRGFDNFVLIVESDGKQQMLYKHAVSTVVPVKPVSGLFNSVAAED
jgi:host factor-I protein